MKMKGEFPLKNELCHEKTNILVSDQVRHKQGCTATEDTVDSEMFART